MKTFVIEGRYQPEFVLCDKYSAKKIWMNWDDLCDPRREVLRFDSKKEAVKYMKDYHRNEDYRVSEINFCEKCQSFHPEPDTECPYEAEV